MYERADVGLVDQSYSSLSNLLIKCNVERSATLSRLVGRNHPAKSMSQSQILSTIPIASSYDTTGIPLSIDTNTTMQIHAGPDLQIQPIQISYGSKIIPIQNPHQIQYGSMITSSFEIPHQISYGSIITPSIQAPNIRLRDYDKGCRSNINTTNVLPSSIMSSVLCPSHLTTLKYSNVSKPCDNSQVRFLLQI